MKKKIVLSLIALVAATSISAFADINIKVNGKNVPFSTSDNYGVPFVDENNRTLVPFRKTLEFAGATVDWIADSKTAVAKKDGIEVKVPIGEKFIYIDGEIETIDTQAIIKEGRTYLPIRAVLEALEYEIGWDQSTQTVVAQTEEYVSSVEEVPLITEEKVVSREEVIIGEIPGIDSMNTHLTKVRLMPQCPVKLSKKNIKESDDHIVVAHVGDSINDYPIMLCLINNEVVYSASGHYNNSDGTMSFFLPKEKDFFHYDMFGFYSFQNDTEIIIFDNPFK